MSIHIHQRSWTQRTRQGTDGEKELSLLFDVCYQYAMLSKFMIFNEYEQYVNHRFCYLIFTKVTYAESATLDEYEYANYDFGHSMFAKITYAKSTTFDKYEYANYGFCYS